MTYPMIIVMTYQLVVTRQQVIEEALRIRISIAWVCNQHDINTISPKFKSISPSLYNHLSALSTLSCLMLSWAFEFSLGVQFWILNSANRLKGADKTKQAYFSNPMQISIFLSQRFQNRWKGKYFCHQFKGKPPVKKNVFFWALPKLPHPPLPPIWASCTVFWTSKTTF